MNETIVIAFISLIGTLFGTFGGIMTSNKLTGYRIEQLENKMEKEMEKYSKLAERTFKLEESTALQEEKIKVANHRIDDLEKKHA